MRYFVQKCIVQDKGIYCPDDKNTDSSPKFNGYSIE